MKFGSHPCSQKGFCVDCLSANTLHTPHAINSINPSRHLSRCKTLFCGPLMFRRVVHIFLHNTSVFDAIYALILVPHIRNTLFRNWKSLTFRKKFVLNHISTACSWNFVEMLDKCTLNLPALFFLFFYLISSILWLIFKKYPTFGTISLLWLSFLWVIVKVALNPC